MRLTSLGPAMKLFEVFVATGCASPDLPGDW